MRSPSPVSLAPSDHVRQDTFLSLIRTADLQRSDRIAVTGRQSLDMLSALCRQGFDRVCCCTGLQSLGGGEPAQDVLIFASADDAAFETALSRLGRRLRPGGSLLIGAPAFPPRLHHLRIAALLRAQGFQMEGLHALSGDGFLMRARKPVEEKTSCAA